MQVRLKMTPEEVVQACQEQLLQARTEAMRAKVAWMAREDDVRKWSYKLTLARVEAGKR
jgi:hypothetical protein